MRRRKPFAENLVFLPWWLNGLLAVLSFAILARVLQSLAAVVFLFFAAMASLSALRAALNARMLERQTGVDSLRDLSWKQFENLLGEAYRRKGYAVKETLGGGADGGIDLILRRNGETVLVQCKRWKGKPVPVQIVRELYGILIHQGASEAKLVATTYFTSDAIEFSRDKPIELVNAKTLLHLLRDVQKSNNIAQSNAEGAAFETPECERCQSPMVLRTARKGNNAGRNFWGCSRFPICRGTRAA
jgi:restriction system protein